jgi:ribonuclease R
MENKIVVGEIVEGKLSMVSTGNAYLVDTKLPRDIFIHRNNVNKGLHLDKVKVRVIEGKDRQFEGIVVEVTERFKTEFVGTVKISDNFAFFISDSNKMPTDMFIPLSKLNGALEGQKVIAKLVEWKENAKNPNAEIIEVLGYVGDNDVEIHSILHEYGLPYNFNVDVLSEADSISDKISDSEISERRDMRNILTFTIDPTDAKDFDDALSVQWVDGVLEVGVHIADVSHYLRPDTDLDKEAYRRGTSVYLVDRVVPMLPERLSNGLCSLRPNEDKLCFSAIFKLDNNGVIIDEWFGRTIINSDNRFTYDEAQAVIDKTNSESNELNQGVLTLDKYAKKLRQQRLGDGSITFDKNELRFKLNDENKPVDIIFKVTKDSNRLIEEFMLLANRRVAHLLNKNKYPVINRVHEEPSKEKLTSLKQFIKQFDYYIKTNSADEIKKTLNKLLMDVAGKPEEEMISSLVVRTMQKAYYSLKNLGHYGLGFDDYAHFTSPIRRYPDVMVHRLLGRYLDSKPTPKIEKLEARCTYLSERERKAQKAERDSIKYMQSLYMSERIGKVYSGMITSITEYGIFVTIDENHCEGLLRLLDIDGDIFTTDMANYCVRGNSTGETFKLADKINIIVSSVDIEKKNINFKLIRL